MSWWGKLLGGAFGFLIGGPLGALVGASLGHGFDRGLQGLDEHGEHGEFSRQERAQTAFFTATFSVMGHVAKADGRVTADEIDLADGVMDQLGLGSELRQAARRLFGEGKAPGFPLDAVVAQLRHECRRSSHLTRMFLEIQVHAAWADGRMHAEERRLLERIALGLGLSVEDLRQIEDMVRAEQSFREGGGRSAATSPRLALEDAYALLGVPAECSDAELKRAYRRMMSRHHPDKLVAKGLPEEMMRIATQKTQEIKAAYERVKSARAG